MAAKLNLDKLDLQIIHEMMENAEISYAELGKKLFVSGGTIHVRIKKLQEYRIVKGTRLAVDLKQLGYDVIAFIGIYLEKSSLYDAVEKELRKIPEIVRLNYTTGNYSMFAEIVCKDINKLRFVLHDELQKIKGIERTETFISLEESFLPQCSGGYKLIKTSAKAKTRDGNTNFNIYPENELVMCTKTARYFFLIGFAVILIATVSCQKGGGGSSTEENLVVETLPLANGHVEAPAPGPNFPLKVSVKSAMPSGGVKIDVTGKPDGGTVAFFTNSVTTKNAATDFSITGAPVGVTSILEITVTSISNSTNKWTGNYKFSRK